MSTRSLLVLATMVAVGLARRPMAAARVDTWAPFEVHSGTIAQALLDGLDLAVERLPIQAHIRGSAFMGWLIAPLYALFGNDAFVMKLAPLLWHAVTVGVLVYVLDRFASRRAAVSGALLMLCAPPMLAKISVLGYASHMESTLLFVVALIPFGAIALEGRRSPARFFVFGLTVGLAHTWHLQALLPCLVLAGLVLLREGRALLGWRGVAAAAGAALGAAPSLAFLGLGTMEGSGDLIKMFLLGEGPKAATVRVSTLGLGEQVGPLSKLLVLARGGFVHLLEFFHLGPRWGAPAGWAYALLLLGAGVLALGRDRRRLHPRALLGRERPASLAAPPALHAAALLLFFLVSAATLLLTEVSSGFPNRRLAPLLFSLLVLAALGVAGRRERPAPRALWLALLLPLCLLGAAGQLAALRTSEAARLPNRGECYEWFTRHLQHHAQQNDESFVELIQRIDRGDPRFRSLRYKVPFAPPRADELARPELLVRDVIERGRRSPEEALHRAAQIGRELGRSVPQLGKPSTWELARALPPPYRQAFLHGVGIEMPRARPDDDKRWNEYMELLGKLVHVVPEPFFGPLMEGHGFAFGFTFDAWMEVQIEGVADYAALAPASQEAFFRGFGWGFRQRHHAPPDHVPEGLLFLPHVPPGARAAFEQGYLARRLPPEAQLLAAAEGR